MFTARVKLQNLQWQIAAMHMGAHGAMPLIAMKRKGSRQVRAYCQPLGMILPSPLILF